MRNAKGTPKRKKRAAKRKAAAAPAHRKLRGTKARKPGNLPWYEEVAIARCPKPAQPPSNYDPDFIPIHGKTRRGRRELLAKHLFVKDGKRYQAPVDPFVAAELRRQEIEGKDEAEGMRDIFGRNANWRDALVYGASRDADDLAELGQLLLRAALAGDIKEQRAFMAASRRVASARKSGPSNIARILAVLYGIKYRAEHGCLPTRMATIQELSRYDIRLPRGDKYGHNANRLFTGHFLRQFPTSKRSSKP
jgi:hypothetical protein